MIILLFIISLFTSTIIESFTDYKINIESHNLNIWKIKFPNNSVYKTIEAKNKLTSLSINNFVQLKNYTSYAFITNEENLLIIVDDMHNINRWSIKQLKDGNLTFVMGEPLKFNEQISHVAIVNNYLIVVENNKKIYLWTMFHLEKNLNTPRKVINLDNKLDSIKLSQDTNKIIITSSINIK